MIKKYSKKYKFSIMLVIVLVLIQSVTLLYLPKLMGFIVDKGIAVHNIKYIIRAGIIMLILTLISSLAAIINNYVSSTISSFTARDIRENLFYKIIDLKERDFEKVETSSLIIRSTNDVIQVQSFIGVVLKVFLKVPILSIGGIIMAIMIDKTLSIILFLAVCVIATVFFVVSKKAVPISKNVQEKRDSLNHLLRERLSGIRVIRAFNNEEYEEERFTKENTFLTENIIKINRLTGLILPLLILIMGITSVAVLYFGSYRVESLSMEVGDLMAFIQYVMQIMFSFSLLGLLIIILPRAVISIKRIEEVLKIEDLDDDGEIELDKVETIFFEHVYFSYNEKDVLKDISFSVKRGETIGILGGTGSGKSTLIHLLPRLYRASGGCIKINDRDINLYTKSSLLSKISITLQKTSVFKGSIRENIDFNEGYTEDRIVDAIKNAQAKEFVTDLDYELMRSGKNLSGGQKQRISIARSLAKEADVYLFDDSFSALDLRTEQKLKLALHTRLKDKIVFLVSQKISTIKQADKIIVLDKGKIVGMGVHSELLKSSEIYREIMDSQEVHYG